MRDRGSLPRVSLVPMPPELYASWRGRSTAEYAQEHVAAGNWEAASALERATAQFDELLPSGLETPDHHLWSVRDAADRHVGILWAGPRRGIQRALFIYDLEIAPEMRGQGFGEATLETLHAWAREHGYERVGLHVFGANDVARRLYLRVGYVETDVQMEKRL